MNNVKELVINEIEKKVDVFYKISPIRFKIRCPFCGDSQSNIKDAHLYLKSDNNIDTPILYYCFKGNCGARGIVNKDFLKRLGIEGIDDLVIHTTYNRIANIKQTNINIILGTPTLDSLQIEYIEHRLGVGFNISDYNKFKIVWDIDSLLPYLSNNKITITPNTHGITFLSFDKSTILTRFFRDGEPRWHKSKLFNSENRSFYTISSTIDLFINSDITVNIAEGIFDILSIYKNFNYDNSIFIATLSSDYESAIEFIISNGFVGSNINVKFYIDSDIKENILCNKFKKYKWLFKNIYIIKNIKFEDFGTTIENIKLKEIKL